jgi:hypothetical protein
MVNEEFNQCTLITWLPRSRRSERSIKRDMAILHDDVLAIGSEASEFHQCTLLAQQLADVAFILGLTEASEARLLT